MRHRPRLAVAAPVAGFVALRVLEAADVAPAWARSWGDDLLCLPLVLAAVLAVHRLRGAGRTWTLPAIHGLAVVVFYGLLFELVLPRLGRGTADPWDLAAYLAGWSVFQVFLNQPAGPRTPAPQPSH